MFCESPFCDLPFTSIIDVFADGEIFYFDADIQQNVDFTFYIQMSNDFIVGLR